MKLKTYVLIVILILLSGCTETIIKTETKYVYPPEQYFIPTEVIYPPLGSSWGVILDYADNKQPSQVQKCNLDKQSAYEWIKEHKKGAASE